MAEDGWTEMYIDTPEGRKRIGEYRDEAYNWAWRFDREQPAASPDPKSKPITDDPTSVWFYATPDPDA